MICSMTAFARTEKKGSFGTLVCEMRSINHRYLEISFHIPEVLKAFEIPLREAIRELVTRGKIECALRYQPNLDTKQNLFSVNTTLVKELCLASEQIANLLKTPAPIYPTDILRFPGVLETKEIDSSILKTEVIELVKQTTHDLIMVRKREGEDLKKLFLQRMDLMQTELGKVREQLPKVLQYQNERLLKRFADIKLELEPNRLEQEMVIFAQRIDIAEEVERAETHIDEIRRVLKNGGPVGRRLDFILQELNREANTLGSKSVDSVLAYAAVEMKVLIEQVREQVQNVE